MSSYQMVMAGMHNSWLQIADEARDDLWNPRFNYNYRQRGKESAGQSGAQWQTLWPLPRILSGASDVPLALLGQDGSDGGRYEYPSTISRGIYRPYFFRGTVTNSGGTPLGGVVVSAYRTSDNVLAGTNTSDDRGAYECPTPYSGVNHYLIARYASGSLVGGTVDTLQPTL